MSTVATVTTSRQHQTSRAATTISSGDTITPSHHQATSDTNRMNGSIHPSNSHELPLPSSGSTPNFAHATAPHTVKSATSDSWPRTQTRVKSIVVAPIEPSSTHNDEGEHSIDPDEVSAIERQLELLGEDQFDDDEGSENYMWYIFLAALYVFLLNVAGGVYNAIMSNMQQDYFAGQSCEGNSDTPKCSAANSKLTILNGVFDGWGAILALISSPIVGRMSDAYGRKPFIIIAALLIFLPAACISAYWLWGFSMWAFLIVSNAASLLDPPFIMLAFLADVVPQRHRALAFGILISATQLPNCVGALVTTFCSWNTSLWVQLITSFLGLVLACCIPESLPVSRRVQMPPKLLTQLNPFPLLKVLTRYKMFTRLGAVVLLNSFAATGVGSVLSSYLIQNLNASTELQSLFLLYMGGFGFLVGTAGMAVLTRCMRNKAILLLGCIITTAALPPLALAGSKEWSYWLPLGLLGLSNLVFPAASAMKSLNTRGSEQGKIQGALYGMLSIGTCLGETTMGFVFGALVRDSTYYPGGTIWYAVPFSLASCVLVLLTPSSISPSERAAEEVRFAEEEKSIMEEIEEIERQEELTRQHEEQASKNHRWSIQGNSRTSMGKPLLLDQSVSMSTSRSYAVAAPHTPENQTDFSIGPAPDPSFPADESDESAASAVISYAQNF